MSVLTLDRPQLIAEQDDSTAVYHIGNRTNLNCSNGDIVEDNDILIKTTKGLRLDIQKEIYDDLIKSGLTGDQIDKMYVLRERECVNPTWNVEPDEYDEVDEEYQEAKLSKYHGKQDGWDDQLPANFQDQIKNAVLSLLNAGWLHGDLENPNGGNYIIDDIGQVRLIDWETAMWVEPENRWWLRVILQDDPFFDTFGDDPNSTERVKSGMNYARYLISETVDDKRERAQTGERFDVFIWRKYKKQIGSD